MLDEDPRSLAALRIATCSVVLVSSPLRDAVAWGSQIAPLRWPPEGLFRLVELPVSPSIARAAQAVLVAALLCGLVGVWTRRALAVAAIASTYVLGLPQLSGTVVHHHHLVWLLAILAVSPCGDAWSVDARDRGGDPPPPSPRYGAPMTAARLAIAMVYFWPGVWKLRASGLAWITSDNLRNQIWWKAFQGGWTPSPPVDRWPLVCKSLAAATIGFELSFPILILLPRARRWALAAGLAFHLGTARLLHVDFPTLWLLYPGLLGFVRSRAKAATQLGWPPRASLAPLAFVVPIAIYGARGQMNAWPFACYPTFQGVVGTEMPGLRIVAVLEDGREVEVPHGPFRPPRDSVEWGRSWALAGLGAPVDPLRLRAYWRRVRRASDVQALVASARAIRFERAWWSVRPEDRGRPPVRTVQLASVEP